MFDDALTPTIGDGAGYVRARISIAQSPLDNASSVKRGTPGHIEDVADGLYFVDFGELYGVVACEAGELV